MLALYPITKDRFSDFIERSTALFAEGKARAEGISQNEALELAHKQLKKILPDGQETCGHFFFSIQKTDGAQTMGQTVGWLWFALAKHPGSKTIFIYDFVLEPEFQNKGFGREGLLLLEEQALARGADKIKLHVFSWNTKAISLYEKLGYARITDGLQGFEMEKFIPSV